jgi:hypothetical protein
MSVLAYYTFSDTSFSLASFRPEIVVHLRRRRSATAAAKNPQFFLHLWLYGYNDHDNFDHGYIMIGYLDIKYTIYSNSRTPVNSVRVVTCVHVTPAVTAGGKRGETGKAPEVPTHQRRCCMTRRRRRWKHMTSNPVAIVRFTLAMIEG